MGGGRVGDCCLHQVQEQMEQESRTVQHAHSEYMYHQAATSSHSASSPAIVLSPLVALAVRVQFCLSPALVTSRFRLLLFVQLFPFLPLPQLLALLPLLASDSFWRLPRHRLQSCDHSKSVAQFQAALQGPARPEGLFFLALLRQGA